MKKILFIILCIIQFISCYEESRCNYVEIIIESDNNVFVEINNGHDLFVDEKYQRYYLFYQDDEIITGDIKVKTDGTYIKLTVNINMNEYMHETDSYSIETNFFIEPVY